MNDDENSEFDITYMDDIMRTSKNGLHIVSINIHSIRNKIDQLQLELHKLGHAHVVVVSETWIQPGNEAIYNLDGFTSIHLTRSDGYGGLSVFIRNGVNFTPLMQKTLDDIHVVSIKLVSFKLTIHAIYRRPISNNMQPFLNLLDEISETDENCIIIGDTNINVIKQDLNTNNYINTLERNSLRLLNKVDRQAFTFPISDGNPGAPGSLLDHFVSNFADRSFNVSRMDVDFTDHLMMVLSVLYPQSPP